MVEQILLMLEASGSGLNAGEIASQLGRSPQVVAGMLHLLASHGQVEVRAPSIACDRCPIAAFCGPERCVGEIFVSVRARGAQGSAVKWVG